MSTSIIPVTSVQPPVQAASEKPHSTSAAPNKPLAIKPPSDTFQISTASRVVALSAIGRSVDQIAAILGIPASEVNTDLGVSTGSTSSASAITAALAAKQ